MPKIRKKTKADTSAAFSNDVAYRNYRNQTILSTIKRPKPSTSAEARNSKKRFKNASHWAHEILKDPDLKKLYSKAISEKISNAHTAAIQDYLKGPTIHYISLKQYTGSIGDTIRIKATDNFQVTSVNLQIMDRNGEVIERGPAVKYKRKPMIWIYTLTVVNPQLEGTVIKVEASDRPGNTVKKEEKIGVSTLQNIKAINSRSGNTVNLKQPINKSDAVALKLDIRKILDRIEDEQLLRRIYEFLKQSGKSEVGQI